MTGCRAPEIAPWWPDGYGPDNPYLSNGFDGLARGEVYQHYRCITCARWAYECPECHEIRCASHLFHTMFGHVPLTCDQCAPKGIDQTMRGAADGGMILEWSKRS